MEITRKIDSVTVTKKSGTEVSYYLFPEYEIHYNVIDGAIVQDWHQHTKIEETLLVLSGKLEIYWEEGYSVKSTILNTGDLARVENTVHSIKNHGSSPAEFIVFKLILNETDKREIFKTDKQSFDKRKAE